jgi:hypothetical protein
MPPIRLPVGVTNDTVSACWKRINDDIATFLTAKRKRGRPSKTGLATALAHHKRIETAVNALNATLQYYLMPQSGKQAELVRQAQRLLGRFENLQLKIDIDFEPLVFSRKDGTLSGQIRQPRNQDGSQRFGRTCK